MDNPLPIPITVCDESVEGVAHKLEKLVCDHMGISGRVVRSGFFKYEFVWYINDEKYTVALEHHFNPDGWFGRKGRKYFTMYVYKDHDK